MVKLVQGGLLPFLVSVVEAVGLLELGDSLITGGTPFPTVIHSRIGDTQIFQKIQFTSINRYKICHGVA